MTMNIALQLEQEKRDRQGLEAYEAESNRETDSYSLGFFDGLIGSEPSQPERNSYWSGYQIGNREYWAKKLGVLIPSEA